MYGPNIINRQKWSNEYDSILKIPKLSLEISFLLLYTLIFTKKKKLNHIPIYSY